MQESWQGADELLSFKRIIEGGKGEVPRDVGEALTLPFLLLPSYFTWVERRPSIFMEAYRVAPYAQ